MWGGENYVVGASGFGGGGGSVSFDDRPVGRQGNGGVRGGGMSPPSRSPPPGGAPAVTGPMKKLTVAENFYRQAQSDPRHKVAKTKPAKPGAAPRRPNFLVCYLCGQMFGKASLPIHQPQCYMKKLVEWERSEPEVRGPKPLHPEEAAARAPPPVATGGKMGASEIDAFNDAQFQHFNDNMVSCENCGRTFFPDRLVVHKRSCHPDAPGRGSKPVPKPRAASPKRQASPRQPPRPASPPLPEPASFDDQPVGGAGAYAMNGAFECHATTAVDDDPQDFDDEHLARQLANEELAAADAHAVAQSPPPPRKTAPPRPPDPVLEPCPKCGRKFVPRKIETHLLTCKGSVRPPSSTGGGASATTSASAAPSYESSLEPCRYCSRTFNRDRIEKHMSVCLEAKKFNSARGPPAKVKQVVKHQDPMGGGPSPPAAPPSGRPKFCQNCGFKYGDPLPKFCQECGTRVPV
eukprot:Sspe_Gene.48065::Locus_24769_Transcript_1_1_Confidence_1.000_Length_1693::g.48065::m.48065